MLFSTASEVLIADLEELLGEGSLEKMFGSNASQMRSLHVAAEKDSTSQPGTVPCPILSVAECPQTDEVRRPCDDTRHRITSIGSELGPEC